MLKMIIYFHEENVDIFSSYQEIISAIEPVDYEFEELTPDERKFFD